MSPRKCGQGTQISGRQRNDNLEHLDLILAQNLSKPTPGRRRQNCKFQEIIVSTTHHQSTKHCTPPSWFEGPRLLRRAIAQHHRSPNLSSLLAAKFLESEVPISVTNPRSILSAVLRSKRSKANTPLPSASCGHSMTSRYSACSLSSWHTRRAV